jgi:hypothetical protein
MERKILHAKDQGALVKALMKEYDLSKASVYQYLSSTEST